MSTAQHAGVRLLLRLVFTEFKRGLLASVDGRADSLGQEPGATSPGLASLLLQVVLLLKLRCVGESHTTVYLMNGCSIADYLERTHLREHGVLCTAERGLRRIDIAQVQVVNWRLVRFLKAGLAHLFGAATWVLRRSTFDKLQDRLILV